MQIPSYQMHNVLNVYRKQFTRNELSQRQNTGEVTAPGDRVSLSSEGKRQAIIEKVTAEIVERITNFGPQEALDHEIINQLEQDTGTLVTFGDPQNAKFIYNFIDANNEKASATLSINDSDGLVNRLEELAKEAVGKTID
jgi:hypothetical protein